MKSIRARVTIGLLTGQLVLVGALVLGVWWLGARSMTETFDARLDEKVRTLATLVRQEGPYVELEFSEGLMPAYSRAADPEYFQVWIRGAGVLERSDTLLSLGDAQLVEPAGPTGTVVHTDVELVDGRPGRSASLALEIHEYEPIAEDGKRASRRVAAVAVAVARAPLDARLRNLLLGLIGVSAVLLVGSTVLVRRVLRRGLAPIEALSRAVTAIERPGRADGVGGLEAPVELEPIRTAIDRMLVKLGEVFERERRLSGNIAHELRTPLAELRTAMDVALLDPDDVEALREAAQSARTISTDMERTVSALLRMARQSQAAAGAIGTGDLVEAFRAAMKGAAVVAVARDVELPTGALDGLPPCPVAVPERPLALVIGNLVENAASHAPPGTRLDWRLEVEGDAAVLELANPTQHDVDAARAVEPFVTTGAESEHSGLGLAIVRALCDSSGIRLELSAAERRFAVRLEVPRLEAR